jgi:hypothetical protein
MVVFLFWSSLSCVPFDFTRWEQVRKVLIFHPPPTGTPQSEPVGDIS